MNIYLSLEFHQDAQKKSLETARIERVKHDRTEVQQCLHRHFQYFLRCAHIDLT